MFYVRFQSCSKESHLTTVKRIMKYLKTTKTEGLWYQRGANISLMGYSDSNFEGYKVDKKSSNDICHLLGCSLVTLQSKKQACVTLFTTKSKYITTGSYCTIPI